MERNQSSFQGDPPHATGDARGVMGGPRPQPPTVSGSGDATVRAGEARHDDGRGCGWCAKTGEAGGMAEKGRGRIGNIPISSSSASSSEGISSASDEYECDTDISASLATLSASLETLLVSLSSAVSVGGPTSTHAGRWDKTGGGFFFGATSFIFDAAGGADRWVGSGTERCNTGGGGGGGGGRARRACASLRPSGRLRKYPTKDAKRPSNVSIARLRDRGWGSDRGGFGGGSRSRRGGGELWGNGHGGNFRCLGWVSSRHGAAVSQDMEWVRVRQHRS